MKKINKEKQKELMIGVLKYFDQICRDNGIKYSLIGGSLIGAVRHKGIIPWDDDIDVILSKDNYDKIIKLLKENNDSRYQLLDNSASKDYFFPFPKLVDTKTYLVEPLSLKQISQYGIYVDIFCYINVSDDTKKAIKTLNKIKFINGLISRKKLSFDQGIKKAIINITRNIISSIIGSRNLIKIANSIYNKQNMDTKYVISNWPIYENKKEIQLSKNIEDYIDMPFENMTAMIFKNYDSILTTTFGDYMKLPPEDKRVCHGLEAYWREKDEK